MPTETKSGKISPKCYAIIGWAFVHDHLDGETLEECKSMLLGDIAADEFEYNPGERAPELLTPQARERRERNASDAAPSPGRKRAERELAERFPNHFGGERDHHMTGVVSEDRPRSRGPQSTSAAHAELASLIPAFGRGGSF